MSKTKIIINNNGSIKIEGDVELVDAQGNAYGLGGRTVFSLCRCGLSTKKPFCDGACKYPKSGDARVGVCAITSYLNILL